MDPFSITAGIAGLLGLSIQVLQIISVHVEASKNAHAEAIELQQKLTVLVAVLQQLERFIERQGSRTHFSESSVLYGATTQCTKILHDLDTTLSTFVQDTDGESRRLWRFLKWPFRRERHQQTVGLLEEYITVFQLSGQIDSWTLLCKTYDQIAILRTSQARDICHVLDAIQKSSKYHQRQLEAVQKALSDSKRSEILKWIGGDIDPSQKRNLALSTRHEGTGKWLLDSQEFSTWINSAGLTWLHGIPGSGKTVLYSTAVEQVEGLCATFSDRRMAYYDFDFQDPTKQSIESLIRCLLRQLTADEAIVPAAAEKLHQKYKDRGQSPSLQELRTALVDVLRNSTKDTYIIIDALDECPDSIKFSQRKEVFRTLQDILSSRPSNIHVLVTSRPLTDIQGGFHHISELVRNILQKDIDMHYQKIDLDAKKSRQDIKSYVLHRLNNTFDDLNRLPQELRDRMQRKILQKGDGMFLLVTRQLDSLAECTSVEEIENALDDLPEDLDRQYERILDQIESKHIPMVLSVLQWLSVARRVMTLDEVAEAAILTPSHLEVGRRFIAPSRILLICHGLIINGVDLKDLSRRPKEHQHIKVQFAHLTVREYIFSGRSSRFSLTMEAAWNHVTACCIRYLLHMNTIPDPAPEQWPLLAYAARYWNLYLRRLQPFGAELKSAIESLFGDDFESHSFKWLRLEDPLYHYHKGRDGTKFPGRLHYAVNWNLLEIVKALVAGGHSVFAPYRMDDPSADSDGDDVEEIPPLPFEWPETCYTKTKSLRNSLRNIFNCRTVLHFAIKKRDTQLVSVLLSAEQLARKRQLKEDLPDAIPNCGSEEHQLGFWWSALVLAIAVGDSTSVELLLKYHADVKPTLYSDFVEKAFLTALELLYYRLHISIQERGHAVYWPNREAKHNLLRLLVQLQADPSVATSKALRVMACQPDLDAFQSFLGDIATAGEALTMFLEFQGYFEKKSVQEDLRHCKPWSIISQPSSGLHQIFIKAIVTGDAAAIETLREQGELTRLLCGIDIHLTICGMTIMDLAVFCGHFHVATLLHGNGFTYQTAQYRLLYIKWLMQNQKSKVGQGKQLESDKIN